MKKTILLIGFLVPLILKSQNLNDNEDIKRHTLKHVDLVNVKGYLEFLPSNYDETNALYPLIIFLHGKGERGNGTNELYKVAKFGPPKEIEQNASEDMCFNNECFIVISPQLEASQKHWGANIINNVVEHLLNSPENYRIDRDRIYLTGFSLGGIGTYKYSFHNLNTTNKLAAMAPVAGAGVSPDQGCILSERMIPVRSFHSKADKVIGFGWAESSFNNIANCTDPTPIAELIFTTYPKEESVSHTKTADIAYKTDHTYHNPNVYEWFLSHSLNNQNQPPTANAGTDILVNLPKTEVILNGSGTDNDGTIVSYSWEQVTGTSLTLTGSNTANLTITNLTTGIFEFTLTVTDNDGGTASDNVMITIQNEPGNDNIKRHTLKSAKLNATNGYLEFLPANYNQNNNLYPLLIFLHGIGERGNGSSDLYKVATFGPPKEIEQNATVDMCFNNECFIVISPQLIPTVNSWGGFAINSIIDHILNGPDNYRVDPNRIYLTGFGLGGHGTYKFSYHNFNSTNKLAAMATAAGAGVNEDQGCIISERKIPLKAFHSKIDDVVGYNWSEASFNNIVNCTSPIPTADLEFISFRQEEAVTHTETANRVYKTDHTYYNPNVYEWLLSHQLNQNNFLSIPNENEKIYKLNNISESTDVFQLEGNGENENFYNVEIFNLTGQLIYQTNTKFASLSQLPTGIYIYKIVDPSTKLVKKTGKIFQPN